MVLLSRTRERAPALASLINISSVIYWRTFMTTLLALDIGGTKVGWGIVEVGQNYTVVERGSIPTEASRGGADVAERICSLASSLKETHPEASGVAIASAGVVDPAEGKIVSATDIMPGWGGTPLGKLVAQRTGLPVRVLNDVHAHGLGEATLGAGRPIPQSFRSQ